MPDAPQPVAEAPQEGARSRRTYTIGELAKRKAVKAKAAADLKEAEAKLADVAYNVGYIYQHNK